MRNFSGLVLSTLALGGFSTAVDAFEGVVPAAFTTSVPAHFIPSGEAVAEPAGYVSFCIRFADQCRTSDADTFVLNGATWKTLNQVNTSVNAAIWPEDDQSHYGRAEYWNIPTDGRGDCEDYALTKRKALAAAGYPISALRIAIVVTRQAERHAVLTVATDKGDLVLDNLSDEVKGWNATGYHWIERQDPVHAMQWVSVDDRPLLVADKDRNVPIGQISQ